MNALSSGSNFYPSRFFAIGFCLLAAAALPAQRLPPLTIHWDKVTLVSKTTPTLQVVVNPPLRPGQPLGVAAYKALKELGADYVRYVPWLPYPRLAVAELEPPTPAKNIVGFLPHRSHDQRFSRGDRRPLDDYQLQHHSAVALQEPTSRSPIPPTPTRMTGTTTQGTELRDPTGKELGDYYARLVSWYVNGGFTDENGVRHDSGYHYKVPVLGGAERGRL